MAFIILHSVAGVACADDALTGAKMEKLWQSTGIAHFAASPGQVIMIFVGFVLIWLAVAKEFEPLLLLPIGFGTLLVNI